MLMLVIVIVNLTADYTDKKDGEMERRASGATKQSARPTTEDFGGHPFAQGPAQLRGEQASDTLYI
ncbi:MAG: hypothetical protein QOH39_1000 [Verrucomicrobiota bacterium]|jgi:hypothetical protein